MNYRQGHSVATQYYHYFHNQDTQQCVMRPSTPSTSLAWPDRFFPFVLGWGKSLFPPTQHKGKSSLATQD